MSINLDLTAASDMSYKPNLYDVNNILNEHIVGESESRMAVFTTWVLAHQNVNMTGQRSSGKTWITDHVALLLPDKNGLYDVNKGSDKSSWYQTEQLKNHSHVRITEFNKLNKDMKETLKDWGEGKDSTYDVTVMEGGNRYVKKMVLQKKPFIFCLADEEEEKIDEQLRSRLTVVRTDQSEEQNKAVIEQQAMLAFKKDNDNKVPHDVKQSMKGHVSTLPTFAKTVYKHPASMLFQDCIPKIFTDSRRDFPKYLWNTYGICRYFWKERMFIENDGNKMFFVTPMDMWYNHVIFGNMLIESALKCSNMERQLIEILKESSNPLTRNEMMRKTRRMGINISGHMMSRHMTILADLGYIEKEMGTSKMISYKTSELFKDYNFDVNWQDVFAECAKNMKEEYPEQSEEYVKRFIDGDQMVVHPFNGIEINLKELLPAEHKEGQLTFDDNDDSDLDAQDDIVVSEEFLQ